MMTEKTKGRLLSTHIMNASYLTEPCPESFMAKLIVFAFGVMALVAVAVG